MKSHDITIYHSVVGSRLFILIQCVCVVKKQSFLLSVFLFETFGAIHVIRLSFFCFDRNLRGKKKIIFYIFVYVGPWMRFL